VSGGGRWNDSKDGADSAGSGNSQTASSWNIDVFVDIVKELVCDLFDTMELNFLLFSQGCT